MHRLVLPAMTAARTIEAWIVDDTGFPKKGRPSVGVGHQYCGQRGKQENCRVARSALQPHRRACRWPDGSIYRGDGAEDAARRGKAKVPVSVAFQSKLEIALEQITAARDEGLELGVVLADGHSGPFRDGLTALGLDYIVGVQGNVLAWLKGKAPDAGRKPGRSPKGSERGVGKPRSFRARQGAPGRSVRWRVGNATTLGSALRVRPPVHRREPPHLAHWL